MSREIEAKFYVRRLSAIENQLRSGGARLIMPRVHEINLRFDLPDGSLRARGQALRLRRDQQTILTFKGAAKHRDGVLSRDEIEVEVNDFDAARELLEALGYAVSAVYEKYRTTYELKGLHIMLDELPYGDFVEIEGPNEEAVRALAAGLGLDPAAAIPTSYLALFERLCRQYPLNPTQLTFEALETLRPGPDELAVRPAD